MMFNLIGPEEMRQLGEKNIACIIVSYCLSAAITCRGSLGNPDAGISGRAVKTIIEGLGVSPNVGGPEDPKSAAGARWIRLSLSG